MDVNCGQSTQLRNGVGEKTARDTIGIGHYVGVKPTVDGAPDHIRDNRAVVDRNTAGVIRIELIVDQ